MFNAPEEEEIKHGWGSWLKAPNICSLFFSGDKWLREESGGSDGDSLAGGGSGRGDFHERVSQNIGADLIVARSVGYVVDSKEKAADFFVISNPTYDVDVIHVDTY
ncbi:hypothetical protein ACS0TY_005080 [Phlomoides rotata]